jgi:hypothetical protein
VPTVKRSGHPYTVPVIYLWEDGWFYVSGTSNRIWCRHLLHNPAISLSIQGTSPIYGHVGGDGVAEVLEVPDHDIWPVIRRLFDRQFPLADADAKEYWWARLRAEPRLLFRFRPDPLRAIDMSIYEGKASDRRHQAANGVDPTGRPLPPPVSPGRVDSEKEGSHGDR